MGINKFEKQKLEEIRKRTKPVDAQPVIDFLMKSKDKLNKSQREIFKKCIEDGFRKTGEMLIERCFIENVISEKEFIKLKDEKGLDCLELSSVLQAYFGRKDGHFKKDDIPLVVTNPDTNIYKHRDFLFKKLGVTIITPKEACDRIEKEHPEEMKKVKEEIKCK